MLAAMEKQFKPSIRSPINIEEILFLCEREARSDSTNDLAMLAILNAWLGRKKEALLACEHMQITALPQLAPVPEWEARMRGFGRDLSKTIEADAHLKFLEGAIALEGYEYDKPAQIGLQ